MFALFCANASVCLCMPVNVCMDIWNRALRALQKKKACKNGAGMNAFSIYAEMESAGKILRDETQGTQALSKELKGMTIYLCAEHCMLCMCFYCHR